MIRAAALWAILSAQLGAAPASADCAACHQAQATKFHGTAMADALEPVAACSILAAHPELSFQDRQYRTRIVRQGDKSILSVTDDRETITVPLLWAFGRGHSGQTYVFEYRGAMYESRVSFYSRLGKLDLTMGVAGRSAETLEQAAGRKMDAIDARNCFGCHSVGAVKDGKLHLEDITPGVGCESCHDGAVRHAAAMSPGDAGGARMRRLATLSSEEMSDLCGRCHRTWSQVELNGLRGVLNVRFQPYRLANSKCYDADDARIRCTACHDPHGALETKLSSYDAKCQACHSAARQTKICRVAKTGCAGCHMPKIELPGAHATFTDHQIRIARAGDPYPN